RRIATIAWGIYGAQGGTIAPVADAAELSGENWIGFGDSIGSIGPARWLGRTVPANRIGYRLNTVLGLSQAIESGLGIGMLPCFIGDASEKLRRLVAMPFTFDASLWLLTHPDLKNSARVRAFIDFVGRELTRQRPLIEGQTPKTV
ncbi:MAG: substrate-binding domain-containing protein, partial [Beijerinckiaceae bacterium]